jgi:uncharacterized integral membrane protein
MRAKLYAALVIAALVLLFILQNVEVVAVRFLFWHLMLHGQYCYLAPSRSGW